MHLQENPGFQLLDRSSLAYRLNFREAVSTPNLDQYIAQGDPKDGKPFAERDLKPARVGFIRLQDAAEIDCVPMTWAQHVWANLDAVRSTLPQEEQLHALAATVLLKTHDDLFLLSKRSENVRLYPGHWHVSAAGYVDCDKAQHAGCLLHAVFAEIDEEINVTPRDLVFVEQLGLCRHTRADTAVVDVCFHVRTTLTGEKVLGRAAGARDSYEGAVHLFPKDAVLEMIEAEPFVPSAIATILLAFGQ